jgi:hypothetical protein
VTPPLGRALQRRRLGLLDLALTALADQLGDRWQSLLLADCADYSCCSSNSTASGVYSVSQAPGTTIWFVLVRGRAFATASQKRNREW